MFMEINGLSSSKRTMITAIVLTFNEEEHIERCLKSISDVVSVIYVVDSFSTDRTLEIARSFGAEITQRAWKNYANQFQWALDNLPIETEWVMRMDSDEYLEPELVTEIQQKLPALGADIAGIYLKRKVFFMGKWIRFGGFYPHILLRIWRRGQGHIEQRWMDEHIVVSPGAQTIQLNEHLVDDNHKGITFWTAKHNSYATREMVDLLNMKYGLMTADQTMLQTNSSQAKTKRLIKERYYAKLPAAVRAGLYFFYRYILRLGFLDGGRGFMWHFLQGFWYRLLVDIKVMEIETRCQGDVKMMKKILQDDYGVQL
jgi:glycosyltransferase involved in cell wall biosynthesis